VEVRGRKLLVVGDRVLVTPAAGEDRTRVGLLLPQAAIDKMQVQSGRVVEVGPGTPIPAPTEFGDEPWKLGENKPNYVPMQARIGDLALFLRNAAVEIEFENTAYLIVPHAAILLLVRGSGDGERSASSGSAAADDDDDIDLSKLIRLDD